MSGGAGVCGAYSNFSLTRGHSNLQRDRAISKTCMVGFMTQNVRSVQTLQTYMAKMAGVGLGSAMKAIPW